MHSFPHRYVVSSTAIPEGNIVLTSDGVPSLPTETPPEFDGPGGLWSPETLLVAAVADCFLLTFRGIARASRMPWVSVSVTCEGTLDRPDRVTQFTGFDLRATVVLPPQVSEDQARRILQRAEETCLVTRSLKGQTHLHIVVEREQAAAAPDEIVERVPAAEAEVA
jgi:organic hydroperoxide reductase OsmC/OhrA